MKLTTITTHYAKNILMEVSKEEAFLNHELGEMKLITLYPERTYQSIRGFGGAFTEATAYNVSKMSKVNQKEIVEAYFGEKGIGYTLCRTHINSCDFSLGNYAYVEDEEDTELKTFSLERDHQYIIPLIKMAQHTSTGEIQFIASPWSPPAFMKTNGKMNEGGKLKAEYRKLWASYIARYIKEYAKEGIEISMITIQNEPEATQTWDSCTYTAREEMTFVRDYLGPTLEEEGLGHVKIYVWDHNKELVYERTRDILSDKEAAKYVAGVGFHWYTGDHFEAVGLVREVYPDKELLFTEGCVEYSRFMDSSDVQKAEMYAHDILGNLNAGMNGYIDWNMVLDEKGGPNHVGNFCAAPIMCDAQKDTYEKRLTYYYIGHFSKYILPGAKRIALSKYTDKIEVTAFINPNGQKVVVLLNKTDEPVAFTLRDNGKTKPLSIEAHSIMTVCYED